MGCLEAPFVEIMQHAFDNRVSAPNDVRFWSVAHSYPMVFIGMSLELGLRQIQEPDETDCETHHVEASCQLFRANHSVETVALFGIARLMLCFGQYLAFSTILSNPNNRDSQYSCLAGSRGARERERELEVHYQRGGRGMNSARGLQSWWRKLDEL